MVGTWKFKIKLSIMKTQTFYFKKKKKIYEKYRVRNSILFLLEKQLSCIEIVYRKRNSVILSFYSIVSREVFPSKAAKLYVSIVHQ